MAQQPAYSAVVLAGLAVGFAACFLLLSFVDFSFGYDRQVPDVARVQAVKQRINLFPRPEWAVYAFMSLRSRALESGLASEATIVKAMGLPVVIDGQPRKVSLKVVDPDFATIFGLAATLGDVRAALGQPDAVVLTASAARKLFGDAPAMGKTLRVGEATLQVRALLPDHAVNTNVPYEALVGTVTSAWPEAQRNAAFAGQGRASIFVKLKSGVDPATLAAQLQQAVDESPSERKMADSPLGKSLHGRKVTDVALQPLAQIYFDPDLLQSRDGSSHGQRNGVLGLAALALLILLLAVVNYVNLATVRTLRRQREIAMRKLMGATAWRVASQFLAESVLMAALAAGAGLLFAWLLLPLFSDLVRRPLGDLFTPLRCATALLCGVFTGVLAGAYPARCALAVRPGAALAGRGNSETAGGLWLRRVLTVLQFAAAMALCATTLAVGWQAWYGSHASPGFDPRGLLVLDLPDGSEGKSAAVGFAQALARVAGIDDVATISEAVGRDGTMITGSFTTRDGRDARIELKQVSPGWFAQYRIKPVFGRLFDAALDQPDAKAIVLNASGALALGFATPQEAVGQAGPDKRLIVGIAPDIRFLDMRQKVTPILYELKPGAVLTLRSADDAAAVHARVEPVWLRYFPKRLLEVRSAQSLLSAMYDDDLRLARMLGAASAVAVLLAAFGIYVLSAYSVQRSTRQIVMRKLHGAGRGAIARLVGREFVLLVTAGAVLGLPPAALAIERYLGAFVERAPIGVWTLAAALLLAVLVALLATARHTLAALRIAPALALRD